MPSFRLDITAQIEDWRTRGLITTDTADVLKRDVGAQRSDRSFTSIAVWLGAVCLAFGAMTFVAANWQEMARLTRLIILTGGIGLSYVISGILEMREKPRLAEAFTLLGCGIFGATVMLVGQMYHLQGPPAGGVLLWGIGTFAAAVFLKSDAALILSILLATLWTWIEMASSVVNDIHPWFLPVWLVLAGFTWVRRSRIAAHACAVSLLIWALISLTILIERTDGILPAYLAITGSLAAISLTLWSETGQRWLRGFERHAALYLVGFTFCMVAIWMIRDDPDPSLPLSAWLFLTLLFAILAWGPILRDAPSRFDHALCAIWIIAALIVFLLREAGVPYAVEAYAFGLSVWTIRMGGRQEWRPVVSLGYAAFAATMLMIYARAAQGLLGTSLFYMIAGALLLLGAILVPRILASGPKGSTP